MRKGLRCPRIQFLAEVQLRVKIEPPAAVKAVKLVTVGESARRCATRPPIETVPGNEIGGSGHVWTILESAAWSRSS